MYVNEIGGDARFYWLSGLENWHYIRVKWYSNVKLTKLVIPLEMTPVWSYFISLQKSRFRPLSGGHGRLIEVAS